MRKQCVPGPISPPPLKGPGDEAMSGQTNQYQYHSDSSTVTILKSRGPDHWALRTTGCIILYCQHAGGHSGTVSASWSLTNTDCVCTRNLGDHIICLGYLLHILYFNTQTIVYVYHANRKLYLRDICNYASVTWLVSATA